MRCWRRDAWGRSRWWRHTGVPSLRTPPAPRQRSDGLVQDLGHIAAASGVAIDLCTDSVVAALAPLAEAAEALSADPLRWALTGGEDHALAGCFPATALLPDPWYVVGVVRTGGGVTLDGHSYGGSTGWDHFG